MLDHHDTAKHVTDALSLGVVVGTLVNYLPAAAALASLIWTMIRIWETKTVQRAVANIGKPRVLEMFKALFDAIVAYIRRAK